MSGSRLNCFKASETLLGIETSDTTPSLLKAFRFKASETLLGIETTAYAAECVQSIQHGFKASETLLGIETNQASQRVG